MVGAGFDIARLTKQTCLPSVCICQQIQLKKLKTPREIPVFRVLVQVLLYVAVIADFSDLSKTKLSFVQTYL